MVHRLSRLLTILTALATVLAGIPLVTAAPSLDRGCPAVLSAVPREADDAVDNRAESAAELEEREDEREESDPGIDLFADHSGPGRLKSHGLDAVESAARAAERRSCGRLRLIRGPPVCG